MEGNGSGARRAVVIGAGIVGVATALQLQQDGWQVTVVDPEEPGERTSSGNAGLIATHSVTPLAMPGVLRQVPRMLVDPDSPLAIRWRHLPRLLPWLARFARAGAPARVEAVSQALADMMRQALEAYGPLLRAAGAEDLLRRQGVLFAFASERSFAAAEPDLALRKRRGVVMETLRDGELRQLVPALAREVRWGVLFPDVAHTVDPKAMTKALARHLRERGATFLRISANGFGFGPAGVAEVHTAAGAQPAEIAVIAAGAWSRPLAAALGSPVPLETERGYHVMLPAPGVELRLPVVSGDLRFTMTPMARGLRLAGTVELASLDAPPDPSRNRLMMRHARRLLPDLNIVDAQFWMGHRPSLPDSLPVLGRSPRHRNAYFAFGHGHLGLTAAAITGRAIADQAAGRAPPFDLAPFRADRF
ncbi:MAG TPA: FAD-dependent oxidoreductase [Geminicoccaceae bacterium]|nr:FAD-dependent oxidoreductase [Geminicoccaceae bacterium]